MQDAEIANLSRRRRIRYDVGLLTLLVLLTGSLRAWQLTHTEVAARDSIGFIRQAWQLSEQPFAAVVRTGEQHPGYPMIIVAVSWPVRQFVGGPDAATMQLSAQLTSAIASVLLVFPMFFLGKLLFSRSVGFWAALLFQVLPTSSRVMADGLSEATFLLFAATGLWLGVLALRGQSKLLFALAGLAGGLAYLTRPEGAAVVAAIGVVLVGMQIKRQWRRPWLQMATCGLCLLGGCAVVAGPFVAITGTFTIKNTGNQIMDVSKAVSVAPMPPDMKEAAAKTEAPKAAWFTQIWENRWLWGARKLGVELLKGVFYVAWMPALMALWWFRRRFMRVPGQWVLLIASAAMLLVLYRVATFMRYVSDRHTLLLILCACFWSAAGSLALGRRLADRSRKWLESHPSSVRPVFRFGRSLATDPRFWSGLLLVSLTAATLYKNLEPLHANRKGFRDAGQWIADHTDASDEVIDPYCWTHYYAGRVFQEGKAVDVPVGHEHVRYVVLEESGNEHPRLPIVPEAKKMAEAGLKVFECRAQRKKEICDVSVYAVSPRP
jgi:hypothetical protein